MLHGPYTALGQVKGNACLRVDRSGDKGYVLFDCACPLGFPIGERNYVGVWIGLESVATFNTVILGLRPDSGKIRPVNLKNYAGGYSEFNNVWRPGWNYKVYDISSIPFSNIQNLRLLFKYQRGYRGKTLKIDDIKMFDDLRDLRYVQSPVQSRARLQAAYPNQKNLLRKD